jgi:hypothetical protein
MRKKGIVPTAMLAKFDFLKILVPFPDYKI